jgi:hypothetical protein
MRSSIGLYSFVSQSRSVKQSGFRSILNFVGTEGWVPFQRSNGSLFNDQSSVRYVQVGLFSIDKNRDCDKIAEATARH